MYDPFNYSKRTSQKIKIGNISLGGNQPVRIQSMATTDTNDTLNSVEQCIRIVEAGGEIVRFTAQGVREAENLKNIHQTLREKGFQVPLVADIHFNANAADVSAQYVEKVRINPGNFVRPIKIAGVDYSKEEYQLEFERLRERFIQLLEVCKKHHTAIRIGVNHGSLSERMMNRWGDTPEGMVASCMELLEVCEKENFKDVVISMKASNTLSMVHAVRLLVKEMDQHHLHFPLHLGVTEAGDGEDGRIKSAVGIGTLLHDGIGDTIRVSLSEEPEAEIPVARTLVEYIENKQGHKHIEGTIYPTTSIFEYERRKTDAVKNIGGDNPPVVVLNDDGNLNQSPDYFLHHNHLVDQSGYKYPVYTPNELNAYKGDKSALKCISLSYSDLNEEIISNLKNCTRTILLLSSSHANGVGEMRAFFHLLLKEGIHSPVIICRKYDEKVLQTLQIKAAADIGALLLDGFGDGVLIELEKVNSGERITPQQIISLAFGILQASRVRITKTEYISCPSCGRTMFNLQTVIARVKAATSHLKGLKIAIMGCVVNGPGEMADADYGYVGAGRGKVSLYKKKVCLQRNIDENEAVERLIELIKENGDWHDLEV